MSRDLALRLLVAAIGIPVVLGALLLGGWVLGVLIGVVAGLTVHEFYGLMRAKGTEPFGFLGVLATALVTLLLTAAPDPGTAAPVAVGILIILTLTCLAAAIWTRWPEGSPLLDTGATVMGVVYVGGTLAFVPLLRALPANTSGWEVIDAWSGSGYVLLPLLATWVSDSAAYFAGRAWGKRKLAPSASPKKTVVGAVGGLIGAVATSVVVSALWLSEGSGATLGPLAAAAVGLGIGISSQIGDLAESVLKRDAGVKDSGTLLPGHGGFLDRLDALLFAFPVTWLLLWLLGVT